MKKNKKVKTSTIKANLAYYEKNLRPEVEKIVTSIGYCLYKLNFVYEYEQCILRLTISHSENSITLKDCEKVSRKVEEILDAKNPIPFKYNLEVESPGIDSLKNLQKI